MSEAAAQITDDEASALCLGCGLCCAGLFARVRLFPEDLALAARIGEPFLRTAERAYARLPCAFLQETRCSVYQERYVICRKFECKLLRKFKQGEVPATMARHRIAEMRRLLDAVQRAAHTERIGGEGSDDALSPGAPWPASADLAERRQLAEARLLQATYTMYANKHFRPGPDPTGFA